MSTRLSFVSIFLAALLACWGCGERSYSQAKVAGTVTKGGTPVEGATVFFQPIASSTGGVAGPGSIGITDATGRFELKSYKEQTDGAVIGRHRVTISLPLPPGTPEDGFVDPSLLSPIQFRDGSTQIEVPREGLESADFKLDS